MMVKASRPQKTKSRLLQGHLVGFPTFSNKQNKMQVTVYNFQGQDTRTPSLPFWESSLSGSQ